MKRKQRLIPYLFLLPALLVFAVFTAYPLLRALYMSFFDYPFLDREGIRFVGFGNYIKIFQDDSVLSVSFNSTNGFSVNGALWNTLLFVVLFTPFYVILPLLIALALSSIKRGISFLRTCIYVPEIISFAVASVMWALIFNSNFGLANKLLRIMPGTTNLIAKIFGFSTVADGGLRWLSEPGLSLFSVALVCFWNGAAFNVLIYLVGLSKIDPGLYESAAVDGANEWQKFKSITLPQLTPSIGIVSLLSIIGGFKLFVQPWILTPGAEHTKTFLIYLYEKAFRDPCFQFGYASALAYSMAVVLLGVSLFTERLGHEEA